MEVEAAKWFAICLTEFALGVLFGWILHRAVTRTD